MTTRPLVSIVIPTHNRRELLRQTIGSLAAQRHPLDAIEVIVVADGCTDGTERMEFAPCPAVTVIAQPASGPAAARNRGAAIARGTLLIFLDDDVEADAELVNEHQHVHSAVEAPAIVVGYLPPDLDRRRDLFGIALRSWWDAIFERMEQPGHRPTYADVLTGNCSIDASIFRALGGFDERLRCHEDFELGFRVLRAGGRIVFAPAARGVHQERTDLDGALRRKHAEGISDVALARIHPEIWPALPCAREPRRSRKFRALRKAAMSWPVVARAVERCCRWYLAILERARARQHWRAMLEHTLAYAYWRGVAEALAGVPFRALREQVESMRDADPALPSIDLSAGLAAAAAEIDRLSPAGVMLHYGGIHVGTIPVQPWAEPLAGRHLRLVLKTRLARPLARALVIAHGVRPIDGDRFESMAPAVMRARDDTDRGA